MTDPTDQCPWNVRCQKVQGHEGGHQLNDYWNFAALTGSTLRPAMDYGEARETLTTDEMLERATPRPAGVDVERLARALKASWNYEPGSRQQAEAIAREYAALTDSEERT